MSDRVDKFLASTQCADWSRQPLAGDASARRYERLTSSTSETAILMDAGADAASEMKQFETISLALRDSGLAAPQIFETNEKTGLMLLEDLGPHDIARTVQTEPDQMQVCYDAATDVLHKILDVAPLSLPKMTAENAAEWLEPLATWYGDDLIDIQPIQSEMRHAFKDLNMKPDTLALRDYHAENLIWRPNKTELARVGLLDFQDALYAPIGYDLASLTRDARRDVDPFFADTLTQRFAKALNLNLSDISAQIACLAVQRNLRILGIFAGLSKRDKKPQYAALAPRVWAYLKRDLAHPALSELQRTVSACIPEPTPQYLSRWTAR